MFYVYVLRSTKDKSFYFGFTPDLRSRFVKHNAGLVRSTKFSRPWILVYYEAYRSKKDAIVREQQLKRFAKAFAMLKRRIHESIILQG